VSIQAYIIDGLGISVQTAVEIGALIKNLRGGGGGGGGGAAGASGTTYFSTSSIRFEIQQPKKKKRAC
jgi:hypothetical protein